MRKPVPPAHFRSKDPTALEDLRTIKRYLDELQVWTDAQIADAGGGTLTEVQEGTGINVTDGTGPVVTVAADIGTGAGQVAAGNDARFPTSGEKGALAGTSGTPSSSNKYVTDDDARNTNRRTTDAVYETSGPTSLAVGAIADRKFARRVGSTFVGANLYDVTQADITSEIAPKHWWRADNVVTSSGLVDTIVDNGSGGKNFTQTGTARCPTATDGNGKTYLAFDGANDYYQAGAASDWTFASNGTQCTFAFIVSRAAVSTGFEAVLGTVSGDTSKSGFDFYWGYVSSTDQGPLFQVCKGTLNQYVIFVENGRVNNSVQLVVGRTMGLVNIQRASNGVTSFTDAAILTQNSVLTGTCGRNASHTYSSSAPTYALTLGRRADGNTGIGGGQYSNVRIYEIVVDDEAWSERKMQLYANYAKSQYLIDI